MVSVRLILLFTASLMAGCMVTPLKEDDPNRSLNWCPPLPNCVSTEAATFFHSIQPFELIMDYEQAWPLVHDAVSALQGTSIEHEFPGYLYAKSYSRLFHFLDYFEVLVDTEHKTLFVRSSSLLGVTDFFANYLRTERFRAELEAKGVIRANGLSFSPSST